MSQISLKAMLELVDKATAPLKDIMGSSEKTSDALRVQREELKKLSKSQSDITSFRRLSSALKGTRKDLEAAQQTVARLAQEHASVQKPTRSMIKEFEKAKLSVKSLKQAEQDQLRQLQMLRNGLNQAGISTKSLSKDERDLKSRIDASSQALQRKKQQLDKQVASQKRMNDLVKQHKSTQEMMGKVSDTGVRAGAGAAVGAGALAVPIKAFADAEDAATTLKVSMMQSNGQVAKEFNDINQLANQLGTKLPGTTAGFQLMMAKLVQQGISYKAILGGVGQASGYLAVQLKMPFEEAAEFAAKMQDATKTSEKDMLSLMDTIQRSYYLGVDSTNMLQGFSKLSAGMKTIKAEGLKGAQAMAPLLVMADQAAMAGESAGNAYSKIFSSMMDTKGIQSALKGSKLSMNFTNGKGEFGGLDNMFKQLSKLKGLSTETRLPILSDMFGNDAETIQALNLLIDKGQAGYNETLAKMNAQADLQKRVNEQLGTLKNLWDAASGTFTSAMTNFGAAIAPELKQVMTGLTDVSESIGNWSKAHPELSNAIMKTLAVIVILLAAFSAISLALVTLLGPMALLRLTFGVLGVKGFSLINVIRLIGGAFLWLGKGLFMVGRLMMTNPLFLAIGLLAIAAYMIYRNWGPIKQFFISLWGSISTGASTLWLNLKSFFSSGIANISATIINWSPLGLFYRVFASVMSYFGIQLPSTFTGFGQMLMQGLANGIGNSVGAVIAKAKAAAAAVITNVKGAFGIHSPSRVFAQLGAYNMQGLANGISNNSYLANTAVTTASKDMLGYFDPGAIQFDSRPPIASSNNNSATASMPIQQTFNIYASPGMDEKALAQMVAIEVAKAQRPQASGNVRSYSDLD
ncbi:phage tail tape measure protein [Acinetobacter sp. ANC 4169]|uniref:phage tail tape measure protein n=1 Tax=Acinetobacter sp. ANC 4169 TaxID=1977879 RepID=UPI000A357248|nr:phage tail tape measure protein [Acinetobacter sp. ANC 4169]OTG72389.1 phage tail tape measure protein [Acinetobacter sp. ANC 4169]